MRFSLIVGISAILASVAASPIESTQVEHLEKRSSATVTWYSGSSLDNPACGGPTPGNNDLIAAVVPSRGYAKCGDHIKLSHNGKSVTVKVVDYCDGCGSGDWFDVSQGAFKHLASLNTGELYGVSWKKV